MIEDQNLTVPPGIAIFANIMTPFRVGFRLLGRLGYRLLDRWANPIEALFDIGCGIAVISVRQHNHANLLFEADHDLCTVACERTAVPNECAFTVALNLKAQTLSALPVWLNPVHTMHLSQRT